MTTVIRDLPRTTSSAGLAREIVRAHAGMLRSPRREDAALMVSELVSNALLHGTGAIRLKVEVDGDGLRVEVSDQGEVSLAPTPTQGAHGGWGLRIVDQLADDWGVLEGSTRVWFRIVGDSSRS